MVVLDQIVRPARDPRPLGVLVYERLRSMIVSGQLVGDSQIIQERVADELGVSRTPVREALNRLSHEGLVAWVAGVGYVVNALADHDIAHVQQVRSALEPLAMSLAIGHYSIEQLTVASALIDEMTAADPTDVDAHFELNRRFHLTMTEPCGNALLTAMLDDLWNQPINRRITGVYVREPGNISRMIDEHRQIVAACSAGDAARVDVLVDEHLRSGYTATMHPG
jgi:DNA-binding GntR family transcriptional regulator